MKNARLNLAFLRTASDAALEAKIQAVLIAMAGNGNYPSPTVPSLDVIAASLKVFVDAMALSKTRNKVHIALRIQTRAQLVANMRMFANFVTLNANFDRAKLVRTGLDVSAVETTAAKAMGKPQNFKVQLGPNSGEATVICDKLTAAVSFTCYYGVSPIVNNAWQHVSGKARQQVITGLTPGASYSFKLAATDKRGEVEL